MWLLHLTLSHSKYGLELSWGRGCEFSLVHRGRWGCSGFMPISVPSPLSISVTKQHPDFTFSLFNFNWYNFSKRNLWISIIKKIAWEICNSFLQYFKHSPNKPKRNQTNAEHTGNFSPFLRLLLYPLTWTWSLSSLSSGFWRPFLSPLFFKVVQEYSYWGV